MVKNLLLFFLVVFLSTVIILESSCYQVRPFILKSINYGHVICPPAVILIFLKILYVEM